MRKAGLAWLGLGGYVAAYDYWACKTNNETLTQAFHRGTANPAARPLVVIGALVVIKHLGMPRFLPQLDVIQFIADRWRAPIEAVPLVRTAEDVIRSIESD